MICEKCQSRNRKTFKAELVTTFIELENVNQAPVYLCQDIRVCLDCGHTEITFPVAKLEHLKRHAAVSDARPHSSKEGSSKP